MAVVYQTDEEEKKKVGAAQGQGVLAQGNVIGQEPEQKDLTTGGGDSSMVQGTGGASAAQRQGTGTASGAYTNLQAYLDANKNDDFGGRIAGNVQGQVDQAKQAQATAGQGFKQRVDQARVGMDQSLLDKVRTDARAVASSTADKTAFDKMRTAQYKGPGQLTEAQDLYNPAYKASMDAKEQLGAMNTLEGRKAYLKTQAGPQYSKGMGKLDNLLLQNDPNAKKAFEGLQEKNKGFESDYDKLLSELGDYAGKAKGDTEGAKKAASEALSGGFGIQKDKGAERLKSRLGEVEQAGKYREMLKNRDFSGLASNSADAAAKAKEIFGIDPRETNSYDIDGSQFVSSVDPTQLTEDTVRTQDEAAIMKALGELGGDVSGVNLEGAGKFDDERVWDMQQGNFRDALQGRKVDIERGAEAGAAPYNERIQTSKNYMTGTQPRLNKKAEELKIIKATNPNWHRSDYAKNLQAEVNSLNAEMAKHQANIIWNEKERDSTKKSFYDRSGYSSKFKF